MYIHFVDKFHFKCIANLKLVTRRKKKGITLVSFFINLPPCMFYPIIYLRYRRKIFSRTLLRPNLKTIEKSSTLKELFLLSLFNLINAVNIYGRFTISCEEMTF